MIKLEEAGVAVVDTTTGEAVARVTLRFDSVVAAMAWLQGMATGGVAPAAQPAAAGRGKKPAAETPAAQQALPAVTGGAPLVPYVPPANAPPPPVVTERVIPPVAQAPVVALPMQQQLPQTAPAPSAAGLSPELMAAQSFRQVLEWMLRNGYSLADQAAITAKCVEWRAIVPALARINGDIAERAGRAMAVLQAEAQGVQPAPAN